MVSCAQWHGFVPCEVKENSPKWRGTDRATLLEIWKSNRKIKNHRDIEDMNNKINMQCLNINPVSRVYILSIRHIEKS